MDSVVEYSFITIIIMLIPIIAAGSFAYWITRSVNECKNPELEERPNPNQQGKKQT